MPPNQCQPLPDDSQCDPLALRIAFQALFKKRQATYLLVDQQHHLMAVCVDALGLLPMQTEDNNTSKDVITLLSNSLRYPVIDLLSKAQTTGEASCSSYQIDLSANLLCPVTILVTLHTAMGTQEFLSVLIEREESMSLDATYYSRMIEIVEENNRLQVEVLVQRRNEQELAQQAQALARSNANLEEFAYVVSHDLQEPLRAMTAFSQLLEQRYDRQLDVAAKRYISHIVDGGIRMKAMIDGILELSRINNKKLSNSSPTALDHALDIALENLNLICLETQATIHHSTLPTLYVDKNHIVQLLQNLIGNAIKFRGSEPPQINIMAKPQPDKWLFSIEDNGMGIPQDQQQRIFKLFQRLHNQQEQKGYGIGLAICKKIVEHYQGEIWLESSLGNGSIFYFTLAVEAYSNEA
ncbi:GHKL domain-containing protein [Leptolyngbya cf. ectocarpi LEGE 11479]|uniref:histidine kinase n=2 Tax=Leptolyngbya ectocarpi TaxID=1202 RepID=A0A928ZZ39_LEPEC|nr:GHKL domain-containing protein [Leptolyngbya cf. ectocarpi LEGE 11479]